MADEVAFHAYTSVNAGSVVPFVYNDVKTGPTSATAHVGDFMGSGGVGDAFDALAEAAIGKDADVAFITTGRINARLAVLAKAKAPGDRITYAAWAAGARATASVDDQVTYAGRIPLGVVAAFEGLAEEDIRAGALDSLVSPRMKIFVPVSVDGFVSGNANMRFSFTAGGIEDSDSYTRVDQSWDLSDPINRDVTTSPTVRTSGPSSVDFLPDLIEYRYVEADDNVYLEGLFLYFMNIGVGANAYPFYATGEAAYEHTATLGAFELLTLDGVTHPYAAYLTARGVSGASYALASDAVTTAEPSTLSLVAGGALACAVGIVRRRREATVPLRSA